MDREEFLAMVIKPDGKINRMAARLLKRPTSPKWALAREHLLAAAPPFVDANSDLIEAIRAIEHGTVARPTCMTCGEKVSFYSGPPATYARFCSPRCGQLHPETKLLLAETMLRRHGVRNAFMKDGTKERSRQVRAATKEETGHYPGSMTLRSIDERRRTAAKTVETRRRNRELGVVGSKTLQRIEQLRSSVGEEWSSLSFGALGKIASATHSCGATTLQPRLPLTCFTCEAPRKAQLQWRFLKELQEVFKLEAIRDYRLPSGAQLDIYFPDRKMGIEVNGLYWHSEAAPKPRSRHYHQQKVLEAREQGIRVVMIWEDQLRDKKDVVMGRLRSMLNPVKIGARQCQLTGISRNEAASFLEQHHLDGSARGASRHLALSYKDEVLVVATFGKPRFGKERSGLELLRLATKGGFSVQGGISKLLKGVGDKVRTYASLEWGGDGYEKAGGVREGMTQPGYFYYNRSGARRHHRLFFAPSVFQKNTGVEYDTSLSEEENAKKVGCYRCYTAGSWRYVFS